MFIFNLIFSYLILQHLIIENWSLIFFFLLSSLYNYPNSMLTQVDLIFFSLLFFEWIFFLFYHSILNCLIFKFHYFNQFIFYEGTLISWSGRRFDILTWIGSGRFFYLFSLSIIFVTLFIIIAFFICIMKIMQAY